MRTLPINRPAPVDVTLENSRLRARLHWFVMRFTVFYKRRTGDRKRLRAGRHVMSSGISEKEFRLNLLQEYNRTNKRVLKIEQHEGGMEECMDICEKVEFLKKIKDECVEAIRSREPDATTPDAGIDDATVAWVAGFVDTWFEDRIFDIESA